MRFHVGDRGVRLSRFFGFNHLTDCTRFTAVMAARFLRRDTQVSIAYSEELIFPISATLQSTDRHHEIVGQERCHFQLDS
jgi:hypothetical protein